MYMNLYKRILGTVTLTCALLAPFASAHNVEKKSVITGTIEQIDAAKKEIVIHRFTGGTVRLSFLDNASFFYEGDKVQITDFKVGEKVRIERRFYKKALQASR